MKQVKEEYRRNKVIEGIMLAFRALSVNDVVKQSEVERAAEMIRINYQDNELTDKLERTTGTANIPLENTDERTSFVKHENVSEKLADKEAQAKLKEKQKSKNKDMQR